MNSEGSGEVVYRIRDNGNTWHKKYSNIGAAKASIRTKLLEDPDANIRIVEYSVVERKSYPIQSVYTPEFGTKSGYARQRWVRRRSAPREVEE